jgi:hypothetical protein
MNFKHLISLFFIILINLIFFFNPSALAKNKCHRYDGPVPADEKFFNPNVTCDKLDSFLKKLTDAVTNNDIEKLSSLIHYPLRFNSKKMIIIHNKDELKTLYKKIFTTKIKKAILEEKVKEYGWRGFAFGAGRVWFLPESGIDAVNDPDL